ncbi:MAG: hypothetical protein KAG10_09635, partial [Methylococcales bacterium]|nr:hypothetical protein [Methylococcales bacterium]
MDYISIALLVLSLILMLWIIYLKYKSKYTREKYAFASLFALTSLATLGFSSLGYQTPWAVIMKVIAHFSGVEIETVKPEWSEQVLIIGFLMWVTWLIQKTFADWDGEISLNQHEQKKRHDNVHFLSEGFKELQRKCSNQPELALYNAPDYSKQVSALAVPKNNLAWHIQAIELLTLRWQNYYRFETNNDLDWHEKAHCWLGKNVKEDKTTAVFCCRQIPDDEQIKAFVDYVNALQHITTLCEFIIIVQNGEGEERRTLSNEITLQQYTESYLLDSLVNFEDYFLDLKKRVESDCLPDSELVLPDIYVPSTIKNENKQPIEDDLEIYLSKWLNESGQRQLALLGEYGQGKSTGTLMFSHHLVTQHNGKPPRIPILLELRGKSPKTLQPLELLSVWAGHYRIDPKALMKLQQAGRLLLILEGFDEMAEVADGEARFDHFRSLWKFCYPKAKILITGRPNFFLDNHELKALLGVDGSTATGAYVQALHLQPFSLTQIAQSLDKLGSPNRDDICQLAQEDAKFYDVISRPSMLYLVNQIWASELKQRKHEINSALVIGQFIKHSYKRQTEKSHDDVSFMILNESERDYFMTGIAVYMAQERLPNQINGEQFNKIVDQLYET